mgnify:CR=1 FL=1
MRRTGKTNIRAVAEAAGVSPATVSRALHGNASVNEELVQRVLSAARSLGYPVDNRAKKNIVFIMPGVSDNYYARTLTGVIDTVVPLGYRMQIMLSNSDPEQELTCLRDACVPETAGIIIAPVTNSDPRLAALGLANIPMVVTGPRYLGEGLVHVHLDNIEAAYQSTRYLLRLGRKKVAFIVYYWARHIRTYEEFVREYNEAHPGCFTAYDRYTGYCRALEEAGLEPDPSLLVFGGMSYESGYDCAQQLLRADTDFDAVIVPNDRCGAGVLRALQAQGFHVPSQVSLICLNSGLIAKMVSPTLTSMASSEYEIGQNCANQLLRLIDGEPAQSVVIAPKLLIENSTQVSDRSGLKRETI